MGPGDVQLRIIDIPSDSGALVVAAGGSAHKRLWRSTVLVDRSDVLLTMPALPEQLSNTAVIPLSILLGDSPPGETVYIQAFTVGCSFLSPFRASNARAVSSQPSPEANTAGTARNPGTQH